MITSLEVTNFQSHEHTVVKLSEGVNVFRGSSDSGKTALAIRALRWLITNRPTGESFRSHWGGDTAVRASLSDGRWVERKRTKKENCYLIGYPDGKESRFSALAGEVPADVAAALDIDPELAFQLQMDPPFLLSCSSGDVARQLNAVADLSEIDESLVQINRMTRENKASLDAEVQEIGLLEVRLSEFSGLDEQKKQVDLLVDLDRRAEGLRVMADKSYEIYATGQQLRERLDSLKDWTTELKEVEALVGLHESISDMKEKQGKIQDCLRCHESLVSLLGKPLPEKILSRVEELIEWKRQATTTLELSKGLIQAASRVQEKHFEVSTHHATLIALEKQWKREEPVTCPLCGK